jgi:diguanylate cyclase (GGDEF)-like protein
MSTPFVFRNDEPASPRPSVLLASPDSSFIANLQEVFHELHLRFETVTDAGAAICAMRSLEASDILLLDMQLPGMENGQLLAAMQDLGMHRRCAIALIADQVSDDWISRLRLGVLDDIVPRGADSWTWSTHLSTMQRSHELRCELEDLREASLMEMQHDRATGALNRESMLTVLFRETDRVQRLRGALCLALFDIDNFPVWNSKLGEKACDKLLRDVATRTGQILRSYDLLGRMGKSAFLLALPGCSTINAVMLAERMGMDIFGEPFVVLDKAKNAIQVRLTASFGIASSRGRSPVVVLREAEQTLERGKRSGNGAIHCSCESALLDEGQTSSAKLFSESEVPA